MTIKKTTKAAWNIFQFGAYLCMWLSVFVVTARIAVASYASISGASVDIAALTGDLIPDTDGAYDLGSATAGWAEIHGADGTNDWQLTTAAGFTHLQTSEEAAKWSVDDDVSIRSVTLDVSNLYPAVDGQLALGHPSFQWGNVHADAGNIDAMTITGATTLGTSSTMPNSTTIPATCTVGDYYHDTDSNDCIDTASGDGAICVCKSTNTWALVADI